MGLCIRKYSPWIRLSAWWPCRAGPFVSSPHRPATQTSRNACSSPRNLYSKTDTEHNWILMDSGDTKWLENLFSVKNVCLFHFQRILEELKGICWDLEWNILCDVKFEKSNSESGWTWEMLIWSENTITKLFSGRFFFSGCFTKEISCIKIEILQALRGHGTGFLLSKLEAGFIHEITDVSISPTFFRSFLQRKEPVEFCARCKLAMHARDASTLFIQTAFRFPNQRKQNNKINFNAPMKNVFFFIFFFFARLFCFFFVDWISGILSLYVKNIRLRFKHTQVVHNFLA